MTEEREGGEMEEAKEDKHNHKRKQEEVGDDEPKSLYDIFLGQMEEIKERSKGIEVGAMITLAFPRSVSDSLILDKKMNKEDAPPDVLIVSAVLQEYFLMVPPGFASQLGFSSMRGAFEFMQGFNVAQKEMMKDQTLN